MEKCACGQPLHYTRPDIQEAVERLVAEHGADVRVVDGQGRAYMVPRHYIALHGIKEQELHTLGFPPADE